MSHPFPKLHRSPSVSFLYTIQVKESPEEESFSDGLLEYPQYTRPRDLDGMQVPEVLLNGDHAKIRSWRRRESLKATLRYRPDLLESAPLDDKDRKTLNEIRKELTESCSSEN